MKNQMFRLADLRMSYATYLRLGLGFSMVGIATQSAYADATWVGDTSQNWGTAANWSSDPANPSGNFFINTAAVGVFPVISANSPFTPVDLMIGSGTGITGRLDQTAGTAATGSGNWTFVGRTGGTGILNASGGTFTTGQLYVGGGPFNGGGTGTVTINGGAITASNAGDGGDGSGGNIGLGLDSGSNGTINLQSGSLTASTGEIRIGLDGGATGLVNQTGGTAGYAGYVGIGRFGNGTYKLSDGVVNAATGFGFTTIAGSGGSTGLLEVSGGTFNSSTGGMIVGEGWTGTGTAAGTLTVSNSGVVNVGTHNLRLAVGSIATGTVNLNGGTLQVGMVSKGAGTANFNFNGGTLKASGSSTTFMTGLTQAFVDPLGAVIDSNTFDITIGQDLQNGGGGLTKNGAGILTLSGANVFTGASTVNTGTLAFTAKQSSIGSLSVAAPAGLSIKAFDTTTTPLLSTSLGLASGSTLTFDFNSLNYSASTPLISTGALTASGTVGVNILNGGNLPSGAHQLIGYSSFGGGGTFTGAPFSLGTRSSGTLAQAGNTLTLNVTANSPKWTGLDSGNWVVGNTGAAKNWRLITGGATTDYIEGDVVLFDDSVTTGTTDVNVSAANVSPAATTFANSSKSYTLGSTGAFGIAGTGPLTKSGSGSLVITNANTYTGLTTIENGATLTLGDGTTGHDGTISGTSGVANEGTLAYNRFGTSTANYVISGNGAVTKSGPGTQILGGVNSYTGGTTVNAGTLQITTTAGDANTGAIALGGSTFQINLGAAADFTYAPLITLNAASTLSNAAAGSVANLNGQICFTGTLNGNNHALNIANTGLARFYLNGTLNDVSQINVVSGAMGLDINVPADRGTAPIDIASGGSLWFYGNNANPIVNNLTFHGGDGVGAKGALYYEGGNPAPAAFTGTVNLASGTTTTGVAFADDFITLDGVVSGPGGFNVLSGGLALGGANDYTGGTTVTLGRVLAKSSTAFGTGAVSTAAVAGVQVQLGNGVNVANALTLGGSSFTAQGTLHVPTGDATYSGAINIPADTTIGGHFATGGGTLTVAGAVTSSVPVKVRNGIVAFTNPASSYAALAVQQGTVKVGANNAIPTAATVDIGASGAAILDLAGFSQSLAGLTKGANAATVTNSGATDSTLTTTGTTTFNGAIQNGPTHKTALTVGGGALTLGGANTFTGNVTVNTALTLADNAQLRFTPGPPSLTNSIGGAGTLTLDGDFVIDLAGASIGNGNTWTLVNLGSLTETFTDNFSVVDFTQSANVWTKVDGANTWKFSEATGVLTLTIGSNGYSSWATALSLTAGVNDGVAQNADNDGSENGTEYILGGHPLNGSNNPKIYSMIADSEDVGSEKELIMTIAVPQGTPAFPAGSPTSSVNFEGFGITVRGTTDLVTFPVTVNPVTTIIPAGAPNPLVQGGVTYEYRSFSLGGSNGTTSKGFLQVTVTNP
ncbi:autotransporter-associated beta strand repeat-containing protein [Luteolibacter arcticus]|uniref:Autotransporter-associated beta strand repeat-containing protein n=1 Tax=Luteolibacter arcticus TaxID=1581411 RepID=A0ABT3GQN9_9BACT|nr:autotransporter-associated beta strand repeat-containing protein [Luteolibacter arcticus]MCW1925807.1 autotransporter-associated beta strand repeat-containing protein [Luteolibacter arcticus]